MIKVESLIFDYPGKRASFALLVVHAMLPAIFHAAELDVLRAPLSLYPEGGLGPAGVLLVESALAVLLVRRQWLGYARAIDVSREAA